MCFITQKLMNVSWFWMNAGANLDDVTLIDRKVALIDPVQRVLQQRNLRFRYVHVEWHGAVANPLD